MENQDEIAYPLPCCLARRAHKSNTQEKRQQANGSTPGTFRKDNFPPTLEGEMAENDHFASPEKEQL
jgi:hypothetical protein